MPRSPWLVPYCESKQPREELRREEGQPATKHDSRNLTLRSRFAEHEHQSADHDRDERERPRDRPGKRAGEVVGRPFPWGLRRGDGRQQNNRECHCYETLNDPMSSAAHDDLHATGNISCYHTSTRMPPKAKPEPVHTLTTDLSRALGVRRATRLKEVMRQTGLPAEVLLD